MHSVSVVPVRDYETMRVRFSRTDCEAMERAGLLPYRYELVDSTVLRKPPRDLRVARLARQTMLWLVNALGEEFVLSGAGCFVHPHDNDTNAPEPDVLLLNKPDTAIPTKQPRPEDVRLFIEISDSTEAYDLGTKAALYVRAGVPEYWVVSVEERVIYRHLPQADGTYSRTEWRDGQTLAPLDAPGGIGIDLADLLPPLAENPV